MGCVGDLLLHLPGDLVKKILESWVINMYFPLSRLLSVVYLIGSNIQSCSGTLVSAESFVAILSNTVALIHPSKRKEFTNDLFKLWSDAFKIPIENLLRKYIEPLIPPGE